MRLTDAFGRTEAEALADAAMFIGALNKPRVEDDTERQRRDAEHAPGPEPKRYTRAKAKVRPSGDADRRVYEALAQPVSLGFVSKPLFYSTALRRLSAAERQALYGLVKGGALVVLRVGPPDDLWLAREARK